MDYGFARWGKCINRNPRIYLRPAGQYEISDLKFLPGQYGKGNGHTPEIWEFQLTPKNIPKLISWLYMEIGICIYSKEISFGIFLSVAEMLNFPVCQVHLAKYLDMKLKVQPTHY
jgi:hypothetical protein